MFTIATIINCSDECNFNINNVCSLEVIDVNGERFCLNGRRKDKSDTKEIMGTFNSGCSKTGQGWKSKHIKVVK